MISDSNICLTCIPSNIMEETGGIWITGIPLVTAEFDFVKLQNKFKTICPDYGDDLKTDGISQAVEFTSKMVYEVGPKSRKLKRNVDHKWKFNFPNANCTTTLSVSTNRNTEFSGCFVSGKKLCCSVRQASLLAMDTFIKLAKWSYNNYNLIMLTPLARAIFSKEDIPKLAKEMEKPVVEVIEVINSSCQFDGQYLALSEAAPALVFIELATNNLKDRDLAASIISKTLNQYKAHGKQIDPNDYETYAKNAHGGLPAYLNPSLLIQMFEEIRLSSMRQTTSKIQRPSASGTSSREDQVRQQPRETAGATAEELAVQYGGTDDDVSSDNA